MNDSPAKILAEFLRGKGLFTSPAEAKAWPLFVSFLPDEPSQLTDVGAVYDSVGEKQARISGGENVFKYGIQVRVRCASYAEGWAKLMQVEGALETVHLQTVTIGDEQYTIDCFNQTSPIISMGAEVVGTKKRENLSLNGLLLFC